MIVWYSNTKRQATYTSGSPSYTNTNGYHIYTFTGNGSITF
jgi:hypothetical protein